MALPPADMGYGGKSKFRGREKEKENELRFRYVEFEVPVGHPGGDVQ